jgi:hypothetical protein
MAANEKKSEIKKNPEVIIYDILKKSYTYNAKDQRKIKTNKAVNEIKEKTNKAVLEENNETKINKSEKARKKLAKIQTEKVCSNLYYSSKNYIFFTIQGNLKFRREKR